MDEIKKQYTKILNELKEIKNRLLDDLTDYLESESYIDCITGRVKEKESFINKIRSDVDKYSPPFSQIEDLIALRVLVLFPDSAEKIYKKIQKGFLSNVENKYIEPKKANEFGYEGYSLIQSIPLDYVTNLVDSPDYPKVFEIQIQTLYFHAWAEPEHFLRYKYPKSKGKLPKIIEKKLAWLAASSWGLDGVMTDLKNWYENEKDL